MKSIGIGIAGLGTVGAGVVKNIAKNSALLKERAGVDFRIVRAAVRDLARERGLPIAPEALTTDPMELVRDPEVEIVVELMGGIEAPLALLRAAIEAGKTVVTGNKALLAEHGSELFALASKKKVPIFYEAAVAGGIPVIKAVRESLVGNRIDSLQGILNGTSNYILTRMRETGMDFAPALAEAQSLGYAEADPALDINGWDAAHKALILAAIAYGRWIDPSKILVRGITEVTAGDIAFARDLGYCIKLLATLRLLPCSGIELRVVPTLIPTSHVLASVNGVFNAIWLHGDIAGEALFYGRGAGQDPTSSSVIADLVDAAHALQRGRRSPGFDAHELYGEILPAAGSVSPFYLRLSVVDEPGVLARIAGILGTAGIGISSVFQPEASSPGHVPLVLMIHDANYGAMLEALGKIRQLDCVSGEPALFHVERISEKPGGIG